MPILYNSKSFSTQSLDTFSAVYNSISANIKSYAYYGVILLRCDFIVSIESAEGLTNDLLADYGLDTSLAGNLTTLVSLSIFSGLKGIYLRPNIK
jgi:hypothetical protein